MRNAQCPKLLSRRSIEGFTLLFFVFLGCGVNAGGRDFPGGEPSFESVVIDALDPDAWNGVVFLAKAYRQPAYFALRVGSRATSFLDGEGVFDAVGEVGPHAPDASYCRLAWRHSPRETLVTLEWSRLDETTVVGRLKAPKDFQLVLETYIPYSEALWGAQGSYTLDESHRAVVGERYFNNIFDRAARFVVMTDQPLLGSGAYPSLTQLRATMSGSGRLAPFVSRDSLNGAAGLEFSTDDSSMARFVAALGWEKEALLNRAGELLAPGKIDSILKEKAEAYAKRRPSVRGLFEGAPEAIGNSMFWNTLYAASEGLLFPSISRHWASNWGGWVVGEWDCFFGALLTSLEDKAQTAAGIKGILLAQTQDGLVPNVAAGSGTTPDRAEPPVGAYAVWKIYQKYHDRELLEWAYARLKKWHERWLADRGDGQAWRDGNGDGLLEWGSDRGSTPSPGGRGYLQGAKWESGMDDSPMYDDAAFDPHTYTMNLADVGLNSLYTLDAECLAQMAHVLGKEEDRQQFAAEYEHKKQLIREKLWNEKDRIYENRFWDGKFSHRLSPTNFYPLFAGIATPDQAQCMIKEHLLNPKEFWGKYVAPTIARNDRAFSDQFYWRGDIWGPTNYMLYQGINRYRFDEVAREFARKNYDLFMDDWTSNQHDNEQYHAWGGNGGGDPHYTWGALLCLVPLEQYIDENPWEGLRFGILNPASKGEFHGAVWENHSFDVTVGPAETSLVRDGTVRFQVNAGVVVRGYESGASRVAFAIHTESPVEVTTLEFDSGEATLRIDGKAAGRVKVREGRGSFQLPAGEHTVELSR
jgi:hypothetical protein